jgi:hypothetical protein
VFIGSGHPKTRLQKPAIYFKPSASLRPVEHTRKGPPSSNEYMNSLEPITPNLFHGFGFDPLFAANPPHLSALRVSKLTPTASVQKEILRPVRNGARRLFRVAPALIWRIRYSKWQATSETSMIASLDIEATAFSRSALCIDQTSLTLTNGRVEAFEVNNGALCPITCNAGDLITVLYRISPDAEPVQPHDVGSFKHTLELSIRATGLISDQCRPSVLISWKTQIDFSVEHDPSYNKAAYAIERPSSQGEAKGTLPHGISSELSKAPGPDSLPMPEDSSPQQARLSAADMEIVFTISAPEKVYIGKIFQWSVFVVNKSARSRRLGLVVLSRRRTHDGKQHEQKLSNASGSKDDDSIAEAVVDENIVYAKQRHARKDPAELLCLSTDVRIGYVYLRC